jgi:hypothetical protein
MRPRLRDREEVPGRERPGTAPWHEGADDRRSNRRSWLILAALALLAFELTADPAVTVAVGCFKFGWGDFRRSGRMKRSDPDPVRGRVCAQFSLAWGLLKVSMVAFALAFTLVNVSTRWAAAPRNAGAAPGPVWGRDGMAALVITALTLGATSLVSTVAVVSAARSGVRVWIGTRDNWARIVVLCATMTWGCLSVFFVLTLLLVYVDGLAAVPGRNIGAIPYVVGMVGSTVPFVWLWAVLQRRIVARTPRECWGAGAVY